MAIMIDMEMPKNCHECRFCIQEADTDLGVCADCCVTWKQWEAYSVRPDWCPLVEVAEVQDAVSRQAVLDKTYAYGNGYEPDGFCVDVEDIQALPPVQPERKKGRWMRYNTQGPKYICSECHSRFTTPYCYCPHCGSFNREGEMEVD